MKILKKGLFVATVLAALVSCSDNEFVGDPTLVNDNDVGAISFNSGSRAITRAEGAEAAKQLNKNFVVEGIKTVTNTISEVFDNYNVNYSENTAATTASNTANWEYVNQAILSGKTAVSEQTIKYWDFAASQYDFWAYSLGGGNATVESLDFTATGPKGYTISGNKADLSKVYISDLYTAYNPNKTVSGLSDSQTAPAVMGNEVDITFRSLLAKVRMGLYETIPGYSVRNVMFYSSSADDATKTTTATLYASAANLPSFPSSGTSTYTVTFPTTGKINIGESDYNKAHITLGAEDAKDSKVEFGTLSYGKHQEGKHEKTGYVKNEDTNEETWTEIWVQRSTNQPTWAKESGDDVTAGDYSIVMPNENGEVLTLKVDYTLESTDGTGEPITVHGATALVPSQFTKWEPNYAYTYLFKISDNSNGLTNTANADKVGLYPITLDAVVAGSTDGTQETITTVSTPGITTYSLTSDIINNNEYTTSDDIYVVASSDGTLEDLTGKVTLYDITKTNAAYAATEAGVLATLTAYFNIDGSTGVYTGRNSVVLTPVDALDLTVVAIPTIDGRTITVTQGQAALIEQSTTSPLTAGHYYAFVYDITPASPGAMTTQKYEKKTVAVGESVEGLYEYKEISGTGTESDPYVYGYVAAAGVAVEGTDYYDMYTVSTATYVIKVIKIKS